MKEGYKQTKIGLIPQDWNLQRISNITKTTAGGTPSTSKEEYWGGEIRWMNSGELNLKKIVEVEGRITEKGLQNSSTKLIPENCILIGLAGQGKTRGTIAINMIPLCINQSIASIFPNDSFLSIYLYYNLDNRYDELRKLSTGDGGRGGLNLNIINSLYIPLPQLPEQKAIADCLSVWDNAIELQIKLIDAKENRKKALMQQLLNGKKRLPGFKDKWKEFKLGDLFAERNEVKIENLRLLSIGQGGVYPQTDSNKRDISNGDKSKYKRIAPGDIGYNTMRMWQGRSALSSLEGIVSPAYTILKPKNDVNSYFFSLLFTTSKLTNLFWRNSQGLVDDTLNCKYKDFSKIKYLVPSFEEQSKIAEILKTAEKEIRLEKKKLADLYEQKKALMQQLLTGKVRLV